MKSLSDLNSFANTSVTVTDSRPSRVIFDLASPLEPQDQELNVISTTVNINPTVNILDIWNYATADVRFAVTIRPGTVTPLTGSTLVWLSVPSPLSLATAGNTYTITGFTNQTDWQNLGQLVWTLPANYATRPLWYLDLSITYYDSELGTDVVKDWRAYDEDFYYFADLQSEFTLTNTVVKTVRTSISISGAMTFIITDTPQIVPGSASLSSSMSMNTAVRKIARTTSVQTSTVVFTAVNQRVKFFVATNYNISSSLSATIANRTRLMSSSLSSSISLTVSEIKRIRNVASSVSQSFNIYPYINAYTYSYSNSPYTGAFSSSLETPTYTYPYVVDVATTPGPATAIQDYFFNSSLKIRNYRSETGYNYSYHNGGYAEIYDYSGGSWVLNATITNGVASFANNQEKQYYDFTVHISKAEGPTDWLVGTAQDSYDGTGGLADPQLCFIQKISGTWTVTQRINLTFNPNINGNFQNQLDFPFIRMNDTEDTLILIDVTDNIYPYTYTLYRYTRSGSTWSLSNTIDVTSKFSSMELVSPNLDFILTGPYNPSSNAASTSTVKLYKWSGSDYTLDKTITDAYYPDLGAGSPTDVYPPGPAFGLTPGRAYSTVQLPPYKSHYAHQLRGLGEVYKPISGTVSNNGDFVLVQATNESKYLGWQGQSQWPFPTGTLYQRNWPSYQIYHYTDGLVAVIHPEYLTVGATTYEIYADPEDTDTYFRMGWWIKSISTDCNTIEIIGNYDNFNSYIKLFTLTKIPS